MVTRFKIKVVPGASQNKVVGTLGDALKLRIQAPPEKGKANKAVIALLAKFLGVPAKHITICSGHTSHTKVVEVQGLSDATVREHMKK